METLSIIVIIVIMAIFLGLVGLKLYSNIKLKGLRRYKNENKKSKSINTNKS